MVALSTKSVKLSTLSTRGNGFVMQRLRSCRLSKKTNQNIVADLWTTVV